MKVQILVKGLKFREKKFGDTAVLDSDDSVCFDETCGRLERQYEVASKFCEHLKPVLGHNLNKVKYMHTGKTTSLSRLIASVNSQLTGSQNL